MYCYLLILLSSIWQLLRFFVVRVSIFGGRNIFMLMISGTAVKWCIVFGVFGILLSIMGFFNLKKSPDTSIDKVSLMYLAVSLIVSVLSIL